MSTRFIDSIDIEKRAKKAFQQYDSDKEEDEAENQVFPSRIKKLYPDLAQNWSSFDENDSDVQYMGGEKKPK